MRNLVLQRFPYVSLSMFLTTAQALGQQPGKQDFTHNVDPFIGISWRCVTLVNAGPSTLLRFAQDGNIWGEGGSSFARMAIKLSRRGAHNLRHCLLKLRRGSLFVRHGRWWSSGVPVGGFVGHGEFEFASEHELVMGEPGAGVGFAVPGSAGDVDIGR